MRILRVALAGLITLAALLAGAFAAAVILFTGLAGFLVQLFRPRRVANASNPPPAASRRTPGSTGDVIDVVATEIPNHPTER